MPEFEFELFIDNDGNEHYVDVATVTAHYTEQPIASPWVKRNDDHAQYAQPRGSEYEG